MVTKDKSNNTAICHQWKRSIKPADVSLVQWYRSSVWLPGHSQQRIPKNTPVPQPDAASSSQWDYEYIEKYIWLFLVLSFHSFPFVYLYFTTVTNVRSWHKSVRARVNSLALEPLWRRLQVIVQRSEVVLRARSHSGKKTDKCSCAKYCHKICKSVTNS